MRMRSLLGFVVTAGLMLLLPHAPAWAQEAEAITGVVTAEDTGQPLQGVAITVVGTQLGALTTQDGRYAITGVAPGAYELVASLIGYAQRSIDRVTLETGSGAVVDVQLRPQAVALAEIVAVGYGATQRREDITSAVASVTSEQFIQGPAVDAGQLVAGKLPGLTVRTPSGDPRAGTEINVRGFATMRTNGDDNFLEHREATAPLVLVDGVPGSLETLPADDIESVTVLKDGSAGAVYGSRASNGVILITTKRHQGGGATFRYNGYASVSTLYERPDFLSANDFRVLEADGVKGFLDLESDNGFQVPAFIQDVSNGQTSTDWMDELTRRPVSYRHNLSITGGTATTNYTASLDYEDSQGTLMRSDNTETTARFNIGHSMFDGRLTASVNAVYGLREYTNVSDTTYNYAWRQALIRNPTDAVYDENGDWLEPAGYFYENPVRMLTEQDGTYEGRTTRLHGTVNLTPINSLRFSLLAGTTRSSALAGRAETFNSIEGTNAEAVRSDTSRVDRLLQLTGSYSRLIGDHSLSFEGGYDYQDFSQESFGATNSRFPTDQYGWHQLEDGDALGDGEATIDSGFWERKIIGFFGRLNYDWNNRYLLSASLRREGDSRFGANHKWGWFPAVSGGWRLSEESFLAGASFIDDLKLRVGYGITGIPPTSNYGSLASFSFGSRFPHSGRWIQTLEPSRNANADLRWERKSEINLGIDFALFANRLYGSVDLYERNTRDMLYNYDVPSPPFPVGSIEANVGTMRNRGIEAILSYDVLRSSDLSWTTSVNGSTNSNRLVELSDAVYVADDCFVTGGTGEPIQTSTHQVCVGDPVGNFYGWESVDLDEAGRWIVLDSLGTPIPIDDAGLDDRRVLGNGVPKFNLAWNNQARFGSFDLSVNMRGAFGFEVFNVFRAFYENPTISYNVLRSAYEAPYGKTDESGNPILLTSPQTYVSYYIEDGDYWKIDNATLGYTLPASMLGALSNAISNARIYFSGRNLLTLTGYKGLDPEVSANGLAPGTDSRDQYPTVRTFTIGVNLAF